MLVVEVEEPIEVAVGKLRRIRFEPGVYAYVGSARGPGGIEARVGRHLRRGKRLRWHIDYLLDHPEARISDVYVKETAEPLECRVAQALATGFEVIKGFGASDCGCPGHLFRCGSQRLERILGSLGFGSFAGSGGRGPGAA